MKQLAILLLILFSFCKISGQETQKELISKSVNYLKGNQIPKFRKTYPKLYNALIKESAPQYKNAIIDLKNKKIESAVKNLDSLVNDDLLLDEISSDRNFEKLHKEKEWKSFLKRIKSIKSKYNNSLRQTLRKVQNEDQGIRVLYIESLKIKPQNKNLIAKLRTEMKYIDEKNAILIQKIIDKYGWLGKSKIGSEANQTLFLAIQHVNDIALYKGPKAIKETPQEDFIQKTWNQYTKPEYNSVQIDLVNKIIHLKSDSDFMNYLIETSNDSIYTSSNKVLIGILDRKKERFELLKSFYYIKKNLSDQGVFYSRSTKLGTRNYSNTFGVNTFNDPSEMTSEKDEIFWANLSFTYK